MSERNTTSHPQLNDEALIAVIEKQVQWGPRSQAERRSFQARLTERLEHRARRHVPILASAVAAAAALVLWVLPATQGRETSPAPAAALGNSFLSAAYYSGYSEGFGGAEGEGVLRGSYLPADYQAWADALDATDENSGGAS